MRAKTIIGVALAVMLILAALPQALAYDVSEDPYVRVVESQCLDPDNPGWLKPNCPEKVMSELAEKYNKGGLDALTADEAYVLLSRYGTIAREGWVEEISPEEHLELLMKLAEKYPQYPPAWEALMSYAEHPAINDIALMYYAWTRYLELVPTGEMVGGFGDSRGAEWMGLADKLEEYGYAAAAEFPRRVYEEKLYEKLGGKEDLEKIGFYEWREKYIMPMYEARGTLAYRVQSKLAYLTALTGGNLPVAVLVLFGVAFVAIVLALRLMSTGKAVPFIAGVLLLSGVPVYLVLRAPETLSLLVVVFLSYPLVTMTLGAIVFLGAVALLISTIRRRRQVAVA